VRKGATAAEMVEAVRKARAAGLRASVIGILGIGGPELSTEHAEATGRVVSGMDPEYFSMLSLMLVPGTELHRQWQAGEFQLIEPEAMLAELRQVIARLEGLSCCVFRTNHASNYLPLAGTLPQDKARLLKALEEALTLGRSVLRPEAWRAL
jgi:radical SAM superfamily enzyme